MLCFILAVLLLAYILFDVNYFIRITFTVIFGRLFQKNYSIKDTTTIYGLCTTQDVDFYLNHMNNARYVRDLDFARTNFYDRTGIYAQIVAANAIVVQGVTSIRYRRSIPIFAAYKIETKMLYWEGATIFIEQRFITLRDGFVRAIALSRQNLINTDAPTIMKNIPHAESLLNCPEDVKHWLKSIEVSSAKLRNKD